MKKSKKSRRLRKGYRKDGDRNKRFPNSASALVRGITKHWPGVAAPEKFGPDISFREFVQKTNFREVFDGVLSKYPKVRNPPRDLEAMIADMGLGQDSDLEYYRIRAFSDYIETHDFVFLMFCRFISVERRIDDPTQRRLAFEQLTAAIRRLLTTTEEMLADGDATGTLFSSVSHEEQLEEQLQEKADIWIANVHALKKWKDAYREGDLSVVDEADKLP